MIVCIAPPRTAGSLEIQGTVEVEVTVNGLDYTSSKVQFEYYTECDRGYYCPGLTPLSCPNGTSCEFNDMFNFTRCFPGTFQPRGGQATCLPCPVGYICPDHGLSKPVICPAGFVCDLRGLRTLLTPCPPGHYCLRAQKQLTCTVLTSDRASQFRGPGP